MPIIHINVKEKIAKGNKDEFIVCNNSDYEILFDFDKEWEEYNHKTAIVTLSNREFVPILFDGNKCKLPPLQNATFCKIGVMASLENDDATIRISTTTPASINCLESAYDENGEILPPTDDIYQQILAKLNEINLEQEPYNDLPLMNGTANAGSRKEYARGDHIHPRDKTKLDKYTEVSNADRYYGVDGNGNQYVGYVMKHPTYQMNPGYLATYFHKNEAGDEIGGTRAVLLTDTPEKPYQVANKIYVDDGLSGKVPITPDGFSATYAGLFGKTGAGEIEIVTKTSYWDGIESLTDYNINGSVAAYSHRATGENVLYTGTPDMPYQATNKKYVDTGLDGKVDKVTTAYRIYGTDGRGNQKAYPTGWSANASLFQLMDQTPNGGYNDDGSFNGNINGTYMVAIPKKPSHATPKKWVEDNFTVYKHIVSFSVYDYAFISCSFIVYSSQSTPFTAETLPNGMYVGYSDDRYNFLITNFNGNMYVTKLRDTIDTKGYLLGDELYIDSDIVTKL